MLFVHKFGLKYVNRINQLLCANNYVACTLSVPENFKTDFKLIENFITEAEESKLLSELEIDLKRIRYENDHWDDAIIGYRETEKKSWNKENDVILNRLKLKAFYDNNVLPYAHILDLSPDGYIKPHVDSVKFCGNTIAILSLLSQSILRLSNIHQENLKVDYLIPARSLYILKDEARYNYNHEILPNYTIFNGETIVKCRRISIVCRNYPPKLENCNLK